MGRLIGVAVDVGVGVADGVLVRVGLAVCVDVVVAVWVRVAVGGGVLVRVALAVYVGVLVATGVRVRVTVAVGVLVAAGGAAVSLLLPHADTKSRVLLTSRVENVCCGFIVNASFRLRLVAMLGLLLGLVEEVVGGVRHQGLAADVC
jgi:hypothetical protein